MKLSMGHSGKIKANSKNDSTLLEKSKTAWNKENNIDHRKRLKQVNMKFIRISHRRVTSKGISEMIEIWNKTEYKLNQRQWHIGEEREDKPTTRGAGRRRPGPPRPQRRCRSGSSTPREIGGAAHGMSLRRRARASRARPGPRVWTRQQQEKRLN